MSTTKLKYVDDQDWSGLFDKYDDIELDGERYANKSQLCYQKFVDKVDLNPKIPQQRRDKSDRATTDHALDKRSRTILFKMMSQGHFCEINGCLSTGKEANVYHAVNEAGLEFAVKVYMTSIMPFKSRDKYVTGDFRMRKGYSKSSSWRLVSKWAEKEYRNLIRITQAGSIPAPIPLRLKGVVLQMSLIGENGYPAPKLKDISGGNWGEENAPNWPLLYEQVVRDVRTLYQKCRLVHADLSEYNLLYMDNKVWMIDVSQAVEHESSQALVYLRSDCHNVNQFFRRQGVATLTLREFFEWTVDQSLPAPDTPESMVALRALLARAESRGSEATVEHEDLAFRHVHIPRSLAGVASFVRDFLRVQSGVMSPDDVYYAAVTGLEPNLTGARVYRPPTADSDAADAAVNTDTDGNGEAALSGDESETCGQTGGDSIGEDSDTASSTSTLSFDRPDESEEHIEKLSKSRLRHVSGEKDKQLDVCMAGECGGGLEQDKASRLEEMDEVMAGAESDSDGVNAVGISVHRQRLRDESPNSRRLRKQAVKQLQADQRKNKIPKHVKLRRKRLSTKS